MRWLFITGVSLDISGAILVLLAILRARPSDLAHESMTVLGYSGARMRARAEERRYAFSGAVLLGAGFVLQLAGYAWEFSSWWLLGYAGGLAIGSFILVPVAAKGISNRFFAAAEQAAQQMLEDDRARVEAQQRKAQQGED